MNAPLPVQQPAIPSRFDAQSTAAEVIAGIDLGGTTAIVTGGASGIGTETARVLALAGADVLIAVRDMTAGRRVADAINAEAGATRVTVGSLDLSDLASVRAFAAQWSERPLNLLINNAGVMACPQGRTRDGFETQFGVNHLGHFLLSELLVPALSAGAPARVVSLSSRGHMFANVDFGDPHYDRRDYDPMNAYGQSKTANALFAVEFDRRYRDRGIRAFSVMPGVIATSLERHMTDDLYGRIGIKPIAERDPSQLKSIAQGAATTVWAATAPELADQGGLYLDDCSVARLYERGLRGALVMPFAIDPDNAARLWTLSVDAVGLD